MYKTVNLTYTLLRVVNIFVLKSAITYVMVRKNKISK